MDMQLEICCAYELIPSAYWCIDGIGTLSNYCAREREKKDVRNGQQQGGDKSVVFAFHFLLIQ